MGRGPGGPLQGQGLRDGGDALKIALAQINPRVGDLEGNAAKIRQSIEAAREKGAALAVFPELAVCGYTPRDFLVRRDFLDACRRTLDRLAAETKGIAALVGFPERRDPPGRPCFNSLALLADGRVREVARKCLLPAYDVFDEPRYFEPATEPVLVEVGGVRIALTICEDLWNDKGFWTQQAYPLDPCALAVSRGAELLLNASASPFWQGKGKLREEMIAAAAKRHGVPVLYANQVGGNDELVYDGRSLAFDASGRLQALGKAFEEDLLIVDVEAGKVAGSLAPAMEETEAAYRALVLGIRDYATKCGFRSAVLGLSGGIDSALTACLAADALGPENILGVSLPSRFSSDHSKSDAERLAKSLGIRFRAVPIESMHQAALYTLQGVFEGRAADATEENLQSRIRGQILMALANKFGHLLLSTGNKSELAMGYCTLYGDMAGGLTVLADVPKTFVYELSRWVNQRQGGRIPEGSITKAPSAELRPNQTDQDTLPPYEVLDRILFQYVDLEKAPGEIEAPGELVRQIVAAVDHAEFKRRQAAPGIKISARAFGTGRRLPIAHGWRP